ncbi:MAG: glycosyltransferase [Chitinophagales bacterium]|nr:glycosyltransferase [Bacteroidota bacterium]MCB9042738.1 glycosyltransferase [Chitinophagales bacterium]
MHLFLAFVWIIALVVHLCWIYLVFGAVLSKKKAIHVSDKKNTALPLSVIICARNEAHNLQENLPAILTQDYPNFEVIVVNDRSKDTSAQVLATLEKKFPHLKIIQLSPSEKTTHLGKKNALWEGLQAANKDFVVVTDADCKPASGIWLQLLAKKLSPQHIVLGFSPYYKEPSIVNAWVQYETALTALQYGGFAQRNCAYMGVGRNMAYDKNIALQSSVFSDYAQKLSGDDDLLVAHFANKKAVNLSTEAAAFTFSQAPDSFYAWLIQKKRHLSSAQNYPFRISALLSIFALVHVASYALLLWLLLCYPAYCAAILLIFLFHETAQAILFWRLHQQFPSLVPRVQNMLVFDFLHIFYYITMFFLSFGKPKKWKANE